MYGIPGNFTTVSITRERLQELLVAEEDARRLKKLIQQKAEDYLPLSFDEVRFLAAFLGVGLNKDESEGAENGG